MIPAGEPEGAGLTLRIEGDTVYCAEGGAGFRELSLGDTAEARHLKELLARDPAARSQSGIRLAPTILAGAGGAGFHWTPVQDSSANRTRPVGSGDRRSNPPSAGSEGTAAPGSPPGANLDSPAKKG